MNRGKNDNEVLIVGAGAVGSSLAYALAVRGIAVTVVAEEPVHAAPELRTSALTNSSCHWLAGLGLWPLTDLKAAPLKALQILNHKGDGRLRFDAADQNRENLGAIVNHHALESLLRTRAQALTGILWHADTAKRVTVHSDGVLVQLAGGQTLSAPLIIAADGVRSALRDQLGVSLWQRHYGQTAVCANVSLGRPHDNVAWQRFLSTGPLALLPLPDPQEASLIWSTTTLEAQRLEGLSATDFNTALMSAFGDSLGVLQALGPRAHFPLIASHADHYVGPRFALVGDAAHRVHPLAGQGVNLGFGDAEALVAALLDERVRGADLSDPRRLRRYERSRKGANLSMLIATDLLNRSFRSTGLLQGFLTIGLNVTDTLNPLKAFFMNQAGAQPLKRP